MGFIEDDIREILIKMPLECAYLDYKIVPYYSNNKHDYIKDVIDEHRNQDSIVALSTAPCKAYFMLLSNHSYRGASI